MWRLNRRLRIGWPDTLLRHEQEIELAQQLEAGGREAVTRLIEANIRLAVSLAEPLARIPLEDLVQRVRLWPSARRGEVRVALQVQVQHVRDLVDPAGHAPLYRQSAP